MFKTPEFESNELNFQMDSVEVRTVQFVYDPVEYLVRFRAQLHSRDFDGVDIVKKTIDEIEGIHAVMYEQNSSVENVHLAEYLTFDPYSPEALIGLFTLLKQSHFSYEEIKVWIEMEADDMTQKQRLKNRSMGIYLNKVYGK